MKRSFVLICLTIVILSFIPTKEKDLIGKYLSETKVFIDSAVKTDWIPFQPKDSLYYKKHGMVKVGARMKNHYSFKIELILQENHSYSQTTSNDFLNVPFISEGTWKVRNDSLLLRETNTSGHIVHYSIDPGKDFDQVFIVKGGNLWDGNSCLKKIKK